eukprot:6001702-Pyramimonas_sp.AAC.1
MSGGSSDPRAGGSSSAARIRAALEEVPVQFEQDGDSVLISGLPALLLQALINSYMGDRGPI